MVALGGSWGRKWLIRGLEEFLSISKNNLKGLLAAHCGIYQLSKLAFPFVEQDNVDDRKDAL